MRDVAVVFSLFFVISCAPEQPKAVIAGGDVEKGKELVRRYGCGVCHMTPGVDGPQGTLGPSLAGFAARPAIAGRVPKTPEVLVRYIANPPEVDPQTSMPALGITEEEARHIAAWLATLRD